LGSVPDGDYQAGAIAFGGRQRQTFPMAPFDRDGLRASAERIEVLPVGTPIHEVLEEARAWLALERGRGAVVLFSDGLVTDAFGRAVDPHRSVEAARELAFFYEGELCFHTVQVGDSEEGARELREIAGATSCGSFRRAAASPDETWLHAFHRAVFLGERRAPAAVATPRPVSPEPAPSGPWSIHFEVDSAEVPAGYEQQLGEVAGLLARDPELHLRVSGHTDARGEHDYNQRLSLDRAEATRDALVRAGVAAGRIEVRGYGPAQPLAPNDSVRNRSANRRAQIELVR